MYGNVVDSFYELMVLFMTYCTVVRYLNRFGNTCTSGSLYIATGRYSEQPNVIPRHE